MTKHGTPLSSTQTAHFLGDAVRALTLAVPQLSEKELRYWSQSTGELQEVFLHSLRRLDYAELAFAPYALYEMQLDAKLTWQELLTKARFDFIGHDVEKFLSKIRIPERDFSYLRRIQLTRIDSGKMKTMGVIMEQKKLGLSMPHPFDALLLASAFPMLLTEVPIIFLEYTAHEIRRRPALSLEYVSGRRTIKLIEITDTTEWKPDCKFAGHNN